MNAVNQQPTTNTQQPRFKCRHIFTDGRRCASPSLRQEHFCYFHHTTRRPIAPETQKERRRTTARLNEFHIPLPEDRSAIQSSIGIILQKIATNDLDPRRAGLLLYGLQIASLNLPKQQEREEEDAEELVQEFTTDPEYGTLAPQTEIHEKKSSIALLLEELRSPGKLSAFAEPGSPASGLSSLGWDGGGPASASVLPQIQATARTYPSSKPTAQSSPLRSNQAVLPQIQACEYTHYLNPVPRTQHLVHSSSHSRLSHLNWYKSRRAAQDLSPANLLLIGRKLR